MPARKRVNRTDLTLRNLHALKKRLIVLEAQVNVLRRWRDQMLKPISAPTFKAGDLVTIGSDGKRQRLLIGRVRHAK